MIKWNKWLIRMMPIGLSIIIIGSSLLLINTKTNDQLVHHVSSSTKQHSTSFIKNIDFYQNNQFNILLLDSSYANVNANIFYTDQIKFNNLQNLIKSNINELIKNFDANIMQIDAININKLNDNETFLYNNVSISGLKKKKLMAN